MILSWLSLILSRIGRQFFVEKNAQWRRIFIVILAAFHAPYISAQKKGSYRNTCYKEYDNYTHNLLLTAQKYHAVNEGKMTYISKKPDIDQDCYFNKKASL